MWCLVKAAVFVLSDRNVPGKKVRVKCGGITEGGVLIVYSHLYHSQLPKEKHHLLFYFLLSPSNEI